MNEESKYRYDGEYRTIAECIDYIHQKASKFSDPELRQSYIDKLSQVYTNAMISEESQKIHERGKDRISHFMQTVIAPVVGAVGLVAIVVIVLYNPFPTKFQSGTLWVVLCLLSGAFAAMIPGFLKVNYLNRIRATSGFAVMVIMYFSVTKAMALDDSSRISKLTVFVAQKDTLQLESVSIDFDQNSVKPFCDYTSNELHDYYRGIDGKIDTFTYFRRSDGLIYSSQSCQDIKERQVVAVSNNVMHLFFNKRDAYLFFLKKIAK